MDEKFVCPCGLTCCDCLFYASEIYETAQKLKELIVKYDFDKFLILLNRGNSRNELGEHFELSENLSWEKIGQYFETFKHIPEFMKVLDSIIKIQCKATCQEAGGCSFGGITNECEALKCIKIKNYKGCWQCEGYKNCEKLALLKRNYGSVIDDNLKIVKEQGVSAVESRGNQYYVWQRKRSDK